MATTAHSLPAMDPAPEAPTEGQPAPAEVQRSPISADREATQSSKDSADLSMEPNQEHEQSATLEDNPADDYDEIGSLTARLSELSERAEKAQKQSQSKGKIAKFYNRVRPMINGRLMAVLTIANMVIFVLIVCLIIVLTVMGALVIWKNSQLNGLLAKQYNDQCAIIWEDKWSSCSHNCTDRSETDHVVLPMKTRKVKAIYGGCSHDQFEEEVFPCNLHSCLPPYPEEQKADDNRNNNSTPTTTKSR